MTGSATHPADELPLVSVVVPFYNSERFFEEAIESVLSQTYEKWELLLVDDGSTDGSRPIADRFAAAMPDRVVVLEHPGHRGLPASRNLGISRAQGDYVAGLDSDDIWLPRRLEHQIQLFLEHPEVGMVCGPTWYWFSWADRATDRDLDMRRELNLDYNRRYEPPDLLCRLILAEIHSPATGAALIRRSLLQRVGGYVQDFPAMYEDQVMLSKILLHAPVYVSGEALDRYRQHDESITALANSSITDIHLLLSRERRMYLEWAADYVATEGLFNQELDEALKVALAPYRHPWRYRLTHPGELSRWAASTLLPTGSQRALWRWVHRRRQNAAKEAGR
ncbi:MAG: glycosyltransferase family 2 protein [Acidimicrobiia bacterium]|nr:glycosyltransferase family 2 protein [Acidimicrobiia bacterium]